MKTSGLTVGSLFSGIGGFDLGFEQAGCEVRWQIEINDHCAKVLSHRWPKVARFADINALVYGRAKNRQKHGLVLDKVDILCGGFPCQDLSIAGKRKGLAGVRSGLFFAFMRAVRLVKPRWVVIENVPGLLTSHGGRDFHTILATLAECGMRRSYRILDSQYFGLAQRRDRVFIIGHSRACGDDSESVLFEPAGREGHSAAGRKTRPRVAPCLESGANRTGGTRPPGSTVDTAETLQVVAATLRGRSHGAGVNPPGRGGEDDVNLIPFDTGVRRLTPLECERLQGFPDGWTCLCGEGHRGSSFCKCTDSARYKALGNAVSVPVARWIADRIVATEALALAVTA